MKWDKDSIQSLSSEEISNLRANARKRGASEIVAVCNDEEERRLLIKPKARARSTRSIPASADGKWLSELSARWGAFAKKAVEELGFSEEKARQLSSNWKGFRVHKITAKDGGAKVGGSEKRKDARFYRFLSTRIKDDILSVAAFMRIGEDTRAMNYQVYGPAWLIGSAGVSIQEANREGIHNSGEYQSLEKDFFLIFSQDAEALNEYKRLLDRLIKKHEVDHSSDIYVPDAPVHFRYF